jgi:enamine deaminase RidA (YjgF/YER057c/UK114 family)
MKYGHARVPSSRCRALQQSREDMRWKSNSINPPGIFKHPRYTRVITVKGPCKFIFIAGQTSSDDTYQPVAKGDYKAQYEAIVEALTVQLKAAGATWDDVVTRRGFALDVLGLNPTRRLIRCSLLSYSVNGLKGTTRAKIRDDRIWRPRGLRPHRRGHPRRSPRARREVAERRSVDGYRGYSCASAQSQRCSGRNDEWSVHGVLVATGWLCYNRSRQFG